MRESCGMWRFLSCIAMILLASSVVRADAIVPDTTPFTGTGQANWGDFPYMAPATNDLGQEVGQYSCPLCTVAPVDSLTVGTYTLTLTFNNSTAPPAGAGINGVVFQQGSISSADIFNGGFNPGDYLLSSNDTNNDATDSLTISFSTPVSAFGAYVQEFDAPNGAAFCATISTTSIGGGSYTAPCGTGVEWVGLEDASGNSLITSVTITTTATTTGDSGYFLVDTGNFLGNGTVPTTTLEPGSFMLTAGGLGVFAWMARKRVRD